MTSLNLENLVALQAAAHRLHTIGDDETAISRRSTEIQVLGEEIEQRAKALIAEVRVARGLSPEEAVRAPRIAVAFNGHSSPPPPEPESDGNGKLTAAMVRDTMQRFQSGFTISELAAELEYGVPEVKRYLDIWMSGGQVRDTKFKVGRAKVYEFIKPEPVQVERPKSRPPEREPPAGLERRATGEPVRVRAMEKLTRKGRSTSGVAHQHRMRDRRYDEMVAAQHKRAAEQQGKAVQARLNEAGGKKKKKGGNDRTANVAKRIEAEARAQAQARTNR